MNTISKMLKADYRFQESDIQILEKTTQDFPWFAIGHQLLAKASYQLDNPNYISHLQKAALLAYNREHLFDFLMNSNSLESKFEEISQEKTEIIQHENKETEGIKAEFRKEEIKPKENQKLEIQDKPIEINTTQTKTDELIENTKGSSPLQSVESPSISPIRNTDGEEIQSRDDLREMVKKELARIEKERNAQKPPLDKEEISTSNTKNEILDKFIKNSPSISKVVEDANEETLRLAKESLIEHYDFVSETLAEIYFKQGNHQKAKKIYQQLILKLPEKKLYFAARIKEIVDNK